MYLKENRRWVPPTWHVLKPETPKRNQLNKRNGRSDETKPLT